MSELNFGDQLVEIGYQHLERATFGDQVFEVRDSGEQLLDVRDHLLEINFWTSELNFGDQLFEIGYQHLEMNFQDQMNTKQA